MKREEIIECEIYKKIYISGDFDIFRATKDLNKCNTIAPWLKSLITTGYNEINDYKIYSTTQEEKDWFEYCELTNMYFSYEDFENIILQEFIQENILNN